MNSVGYPSGGRRSLAWGRTTLQDRFQKDPAERKQVGPRIDGIAADAVFRSDVIVVRRAFLATMQPDEPIRLAETEQHDPLFRRDQDARRPKAAMDESRTLTGEQCGQTLPKAVDDFGRRHRRAAAEIGSPG